MMPFVWLWRAGWVAAILPLVIASLPFQKLNAFHELVLGFATRGKILPSSSKKLSVPQKFFSHFYIVGVIWTTFLLVATWHYACKISPPVSETSLYSSTASQYTGVPHEFSLHKAHSSLREHKYSIWKSVFLLLLMETHVLRRLIESVFVFKYSPSALMHPLGYLVGIGYYVAAPLSLCCTHALEVFNHVVNLYAEFAVEGEARMQEGEIDIWGHVNPLLQFKWYVWIGAAVFFWGWIHQRRCHAILGSLRKSGVKATEYVIPHGDWFEHVSSAHYLAEIVLYAGLVIASGFNDITIWLLFIFVVCNLTTSAVETHKWYIHKFESYPKKRDAVIPFVI